MKGIFLLGVWLVALTLFPATAAETTNRLRVLVVTGGHGFQKEPFLGMFAANPEIAVTHDEHVRTSCSVFDREDLAGFDAVVLYDMKQVMTASQRAGFLSLITNGVGLVVMHHALVSHQDWPDYERIIGGIYPEDQTRRGVSTPELGYQHNVDIPVTVVATNHPVTEGLADFQVHDEIYWGYRVGRDVTPLLSTTHPKSGKPLAWAKTEGKSRVVFIQLGHGPQIFADDSYRRFMARAIRWTAGGRTHE